nr:hypothetical protein [Tanacetum cinerariifolium]
MATLQAKLFRLNRCLSRSIANVNVSKVCAFSYCTATESSKGDNDPVEVTESPELPIWVRILENNSTLVTKTPDDDFVLPSVSYWIENYKQTEPKGDDKNIESDKPEIDATKKITQVLVKHFESVEAVSRKFDLMWQVVEQMVRIGYHYVTINTMAKVIRRLGKAGLHEESIDTFRRIEQFGVKKDLLALNVLVDSLAKEKNVERANEIFLEFKNEIPPNSHTFNSLIHGWSKARDLVKAKTVWEEMKEHGISPDVISYTSLIEAYCSEKDFRKVDELVKEMEEKGCPPNIVTYTIIMHAYGKSKQINEALKVYEKMKAGGCVLDSSFYSSLIYILARAGRLKDAREVFDEMPEQARDTWTYNTMITSVCNNTQEEDALKLLHEMEKSGVKPNFETYAPLLKMCCKLKRMKVLSFLLSHMLDNDVSVGMGAYSLLVRGLCMNGKLKHACLFLEDAVMKGFVPYDTMFKLLEEELEKKGMSST